MPKDAPRSEKPSREGPVELSRRLRLDAQAMLEAAQRSLDATNHSYGLILNRRVDSDRRKAPPREDAGDRRNVDNSVQEFFHAFLDTEPQVRWDDDDARPSAHGPDPRRTDSHQAETPSRSADDAA